MLFIKNSINYNSYKYLSLIVFELFVIQYLLKHITMYYLLFFPGYLIFAISFNYLAFSIFNRSLSKGIILLDMHAYFTYLNDYLYLKHYIFVAFFEEILWRGLPQLILIDYLKYPFAILLFVNSLFVISHFIYKNKIVVPQILEMFLFFCFVTLIYYFSHDIILISLIHLIRNVNHDFIQLELKTITY